MTIIYDKKFPLISIHIPKCAGASFHVVLRKWFGRKLLLHYHDEKDNKKPKRHRLTKFYSKRQYIRKICIHGHFNHSRGNGVEHYYPDVKQFITLVRDPLEIHVSRYFYKKKLGPKAYKDGKLLAMARDHYTIDDYFEEYPKSFLLSFLPKEINEENFENILNEKFIYIGVSEDLQTSIDILANRLGFTSVSVPKYNISKRNEVVSAEHIREFKKNNMLEYEIYNYILQHYRN